MGMEGKKRKGSRIKNVGVRKVAYGLSGHLARVQLGSSLPRSHQVTASLLDCKWSEKALSNAAADLGRPVMVGTTN